MQLTELLGSAEVQLTELLGPTEVQLAELLRSTENAGEDDSSTEDELPPN